MVAITFIPIYLLVNQGHGKARKKALEKCCYELVALMDADDISLVDRFEKQVAMFIHNQKLDVVGGQIAEFIGNPSNIIGRRTVPEEDKEIKRYMKKKCPMNQMSVMFKKDAVDKAGGYIDWYCEEDYYLWLRMAESGAVFANSPDTFVNVRVGNEMSARRGGWKYFLSEAGLQNYMLRKGVISFPRYLLNVVLRFGGEVVLPVRLRTALFRIMRDSFVEDMKENENITDTCGDITYPPFSVAMCVYGKDNPEWFDVALKSVINQTVKPAEIVLVVDGPVPETIHAVIDKYKKLCSWGGKLIVIEFLENKGLGNALRIAVENCSYELIARMDSDDISACDRFEIQLKHMMNREIDVCGGQIEEFIGEMSHIVGKRIVPETDEEIKKYIKKRCPLNHMSVMYRKSSVLKVGNYLDWFWNEDYYLWIRMYLAGMKFRNVPETLVHVRVGEDMYARRGGKNYFQSEIKLQNLMMKEKMITLPVYISNCSKRLIVQLLLPKSIRGWVYRTFARENEKLGSSLKVGDRH